MTQKKQLQKFYDLAEQLGHDLDLLEKGESVSSILELQSLDELKLILVGSGNDTAAKFRAVEILKDQSAVKSEGTTFKDFTNDLADFSAFMKRIEQHMFEGTELSAEDVTRISKAFPLKVNATSTGDVTLAPGQQWDLGTSTSPVVQNIGTLTMGSGSSIIIRNTVLTLTMQTLVKNGGTAPSGGVNYDIAILGNTGDTGNPGGGGGTGGNGSNGNNGACSGPGGPANNGNPGVAGIAGSTGGVGNPGGLGYPALTAKITIGAGGITGSAAALTIVTRSGTGGAGGPGGNGGSGGNGGNGGGGVRCDCVTSNGGNGGNGGAGGNGGTGGTGANGTDGNNVYVTVPVGQGKLVTPITAPVPAGNGGGGGSPGAGGGFGSGGGSPKNASDGANGSGGATGGYGNPGGTSGISGNPGQITITEQ